MSIKVEPNKICLKTAHIIDGFKILQYVLSL